MEDAGHDLKVEQCASRNKLRKKSAATIHVLDDVHHGVVKGRPRGETATLKLLDSRLFDDDAVVAIDVERYNELNIRLLENKNFAVLYISGKETDLSCFQKFYHLRQHQLPIPSPLKMD